MAIILYVILAIFVLLLMIMIHELGHYVAGKILKFEIEEFSIGFGPAIFSKKLKSGEVFSLRCIPLGGYCAFKGEDEEEYEDDEEEEDETIKLDNQDEIQVKTKAIEDTKTDSVNSTTDNLKEGYFNSYACWKRIIVLVSGALFNFISAILFSFILLMSIGSGILETSSITNNLTSEKSFADYGIVLVLDEGQELLPNDRILKLDGEELTFVNGGILNLAKEKGENSFTLTVVRNGKEIEVIARNYIDPDKDKEKEEDKSDDIDPTLNVVGIQAHYIRYSFGSALLKCVPYTFDMARECLVIFGELITGKMGIDKVGGPITTVKTIAVSTQTNLKNLILLFPLIAVNLAVFNLLPIPALDGARAIFVLIEWIFRKPVPREIEGKIHGIGLMILFGLVILIDILHLFVF